MSWLLEVRAAASLCHLEVPGAVNLTQGCKSFAVIERHPIVRMLGHFFMIFSY